MTSALNRKRAERETCLYDGTVVASASFLAATLPTFDPPSVKEHRGAHHCSLVGGSRGLSRAGGLSAEP